MKVKIERVHYVHLRNDEFVTVYGQTIGICGKYDMNRFRLEKSCDELLSYRPGLESMSVYLRQNAKLALAAKSDVERDVLINTVNKVVKGFSAVELPEIYPHVEVLLSLLDKHQTRTIAVASRAAETERLQMFENDVNADPVLQTAFDVLGLTPVVRRLFEVNHEYDDLFRAYIAGKSEEQNINVKQLRQECCKSLTQFFDALQYSAYLYEDVDYMPLINELTLLNRYYNRQLKARTTRRNNGTKTDEEQSIPPMNE
jgi:hypothetical protein